MIKKFLIGFLCVLFTVPIFVLADTAMVENVGENKYKSVSLPPAIVNRANQNLFDITIKNDKNETIPYFINNYLSMEKKTSSDYNSTLVDSYMKDEYYYFDYKLMNTSELKDVKIDYVEFNLKIPNEMYKFEVFGGYDGVNWTSIKKDNVYKLDKVSKNTFLFDKEQKYTYYRFKVEKGIQTLKEVENSFGKINFCYNQLLLLKEYYIDEMQPEFKIEQKEKETQIIIKGLKNLKLHEIEIKSDSIFKRNFYTPDKKHAGELYNLEFQNEKASKLSMPLNGEIGRDDYIFTIINQDDKPINITGVSIKYYTDKLIFDGNGSKTFTINYGDEKITEPQKFDISNYKEEVLKQPIDKLQISEIKETQNKELNENNYKVIFNIVIVAITLLLLGIILIKLKKK